MKYPIVYQKGHGGKEKTLLRRIVSEISEINFNFNFTQLEDDIIKIKEYDTKLISDEQIELLEEILKNKESILEKILELNDIKLNLEKLVAKKASQINQSTLDIATNLKDNFNTIYSEIQDFEEKFNSLQTPVKDILSVHGSSIADYHLTKSEFGSMSMESVGDVKNDDGYESDDLDFM